MTEARIEHVIGCSEDTFWGKLFFEKDYNDRMFLEALRFESFVQVSLDETPERIRRVVDAVPQMPDLPAPLKKLAEQGIGYREIAVFDKRSRRMRIEVQPASLRGKLEVGGEQWTEPVGGSQCRRIYVPQIHCKIFGVGILLEKRMLSEIRKNYDDAAAFTNRYIAEKGL